MSDKLTDRVILAVSRVSGIPAERISMDDSYEELEIDSLAGLEIVAELEEEFRVVLPNEQALRIRTVRESVERLRVAIERSADLPGFGPAPTKD